MEGWWRKRRPPLVVSCVSSARQEFSFAQVWSGERRPLLCAFSLQRRSPASTQLSCRISVRQVKGHEQILQVYTAVAEVRRSMRSSARRHSNPSVAARRRRDSAHPGSARSVVSPQAERDSLPVLMEADCTVTSQTGPRAFKIPSSVRQRVCAALDAAGATGAGWQRLARNLGLER